MSGSQEQKEKFRSKVHCEFQGFSRIYLTKLSYSEDKRGRTEPLLRVACYPLSTDPSKVEVSNPGMVPRHGCFVDGWAGV